MKIIIENEEEVPKQILGSELINFEILTGEMGGDKVDDPWCADKEILMNFNNGKEVRIYIDEKGNLCVYSD